jgi:hypothetical protein
MGVSVILAASCLYPYFSQAGALFSNFGHGYDQVFSMESATSQIGLQSALVTDRASFTEERGGGGR